jgi:DNA polymerase-3 subunit gamma/tau
MYVGGVMQLSIELRPRTLSRVYGQPAVVKQLEKRAIDGNWPTAMLLKGMTGTGKTTVAQIIAMMINCSSSIKIDGEPCGKCPSCRSIIEERFDRDTVRLDGGAASKGDVVDFAHLADASPMYDRNNIFIIEEVDQLSAGAKNALLKLIEKPIKNTYFILLSMMNTGLSPAIQSRCQVFNFRPFTTKDIMLALQVDMKNVGLWEKPGIPTSFYLEVIPAIADSSQGSLRSAIQLLESCITGEFWTVEELRGNLGIVSASSVNEMLFQLLDLKKEFFSSFEGVDTQEFFNLSYTILSNAAVYRITKEAKNEYFAEQTKALSEHKNLMEVLKLFDNIQSLPYLKKSYMISQFTQFFINKKKREIINEG